MRNPHNEPLTDSFDDGTVRSAKSAPERRCVLTGRTEPRERLLRLAIGPEGQVLPDAHAKAPGRGAWIGVSREELEESIAKGHLKGALARGFKGAPLSIPADLPDLAEAALRRAFADRLGIEWRSGNVLAGSDRIAEQARSGRVAWLAHASDAGEDGSKRLDQAWRVGSDAEGTGKTGVRLPLDRAALSVALGRENVVHLALTDRAAARRVDAQLARLARFLRPRDTGQDSPPIGADPPVEGPREGHAA